MITWMITLDDYMHTCVRGPEELEAEGVGMDLPQDPQTSWLKNGVLSRISEFRRCRVSVLSTTANCVTLLYFSSPAVK